MKTTVDLPAPVVRALKLRTVHQGRKLQETTVEILRAGMGQKGQLARHPNTPPAIKTQPLSPPRQVVRHRVKLPLIQCRHPASPAMELTVDKVAEVLLRQEVAWVDEAARR